MGGWRQRLDRGAMPLTLLGLAAVAAHNWRQWQRDKSLLAQLKAPEPLPPLEEWPALPPVSVLVAAWNEATSIEQHIESFLALRYPNRELVLCAGGQDGTYEQALTWAAAQVTVLKQSPGEGKQRALARCLTRAKGSIIFLSDADCLLNDEAVLRILWSLLGEGEDVATGTSRPLRQQHNPFFTYQWATDHYVDAHRPRFITGLLGRNCAVSRTALDEIGGFDADVPTGTDYYMAKRLLKSGYRIRYVRDSVVETRYPGTVRSYWRRQSRWVRNLLLLGPAFGAYDEVRQALRTSLVGLAMLLLPFAALLVGPIFLAIWGVLFFYALLARLRYALFAGRDSYLRLSLEYLSLIPLFVLVDFIAWSRPLVDLLLRRNRW